MTAAFNKNLLARINRELDGDFDLGQFEHVVRWDEAERRIEMHLRSTVWQRVTIRKAGFRFYVREGETIWTESSHKYDARGGRADGRALGISLRRAVVRSRVAARAKSVLRRVAREMNLAKASWNGAVLAESDRTVVVEGNQYFPPDSVRSEYFRSSDTHTVCPWKGTASYHHVEVNGQRNAGCRVVLPRSQTRRVAD